MMKNLVLYCVLASALIPQAAQAQTNSFPATGSAGIGTIAPVPSAQLEMQSTTQGFLAPRMTKAQRDAIVSPATGLLIYQTNTQPGFYYFNGSAWTSVVSKGANTSLSNLSASTSINAALLPNANNTLDLGSSVRNWNELYVNSIKFMDGTTQTTAGGAGGTYTAGTGIDITGTVISNTGDANAADDILTSTIHTGDVSGVYSNLQLGTGVVGSTEVADASISSTDIANGTIAAVDLSSMGAVSGQVMQWNGTAWIPATVGAGAETDPQVGVTTLNLVPRWDGTSLINGAIYDDGDKISVGYNDGLLSFATAAFYNRESAFSTEDIALRGVDQTFSGVTPTTHAYANLGYNTTGLVFLDAPVSHVGVWGNASSVDNSAAVYASNTGTAALDYGVVAKSSGSGTTNIAVYANASGATNNYGIIVPDGGGKSGFNWSSPSALVGIKGNGTDNGFRIIGTDFATDFIVDESGRVGVAFDPTVISAKFSVGGSGYFQGNLGIGVSGSTSPLAVSGTDEVVTVEGTNPYIQLENGPDQIGYIRANSDDFLIATNAENDFGNLIFRTNGTDRMYIDASGNVIIGSTATSPKPGYKLSVDGKVVVEELFVQLSPWPDYVFGNDYALMPLTEVESFISQNNHLPGVPTAEEIETGGLPVGEMQKILMEKIEELTLYVIEIQKQNQALQAEVDSLK